MSIINYDYLRPKKADFLRKWYENEIVFKEHLDIWSGKNATILPLKKFKNDTLLFGRGGVIDFEGNYIESSQIKGRVSLPYEYEKAEYKDEKVVYCGYLINHWGHFLVEAVARLWYFLEKDTSIDKYVFFIEEGVSREIKGNYREFFELLGIWNKLEIINTPTKYREVIVPELGYKWRDYYSKNFLDIFDTISNNVKPISDESFPDKIFFSRSALSKTNDLEFGLESIDDFYKQNGYEILFPERIPLSKMILYIRNANICASFSGTLPHNMLFANNEQKLVIVERLVLNNEIQTDVNTMKNLNVVYIDANIPLYTVNMSGPFIITFNDIMKKYASDNNMVFPCEKYLSKKYLDKCFKKYMKSYKKEYGYQWYMLDWYVGFIDYILEAYREGYKQYGEYLTRQRPFLFKHYFEIHYIKQLINRILKNLTKKIVFYR